MGYALFRLTAAVIPVHSVGSVFIRAAIWVLPAISLFLSLVTLVDVLFRSGTRSDRRCTTSPRRQVVRLR